MSGYSEYHDGTLAMDSIDEVCLDGDYLMGDEIPESAVVNLTVLQGSNESLTLVFDQAHLRDLRLAVQRAEKWLAKKAQETA